MTDAAWYRYISANSARMWDTRICTSALWTPEVVRDHRARWFRVVDADARATAEQKNAVCRGCKRRCLDEAVCITYPVCEFCDEDVNPYAANPRNEHHVRARLPKEIADALYASRTLSEEFDRMKL